MRHRRKPLLLAVWSVLVACSGDRDVAPDSTTGGTVPMQVAVTVGGKTYRAGGPGACASSADASIYQVPATQWHATWAGQEGAEIRRVDLTVWRPKSGGANMLSLALDAGGTTHRIATVKDGEVVGAGSPNVRPKGAGGVLAVAGTDDHGDRILMTVQCERFDEVVAEGG